MLSRNDNRHYFRMMINAEVTLMINEPQQGRTITGMCRDLSASGMSVEIDEPLEPGTLIRVRLASNSSSIPPLDATAKVMRCGQEDKGEHYQLGLAFIEMN